MRKSTPSRVSKGDHTPCSSQNRTWTSRFIRLFKMLRPINKLAFANCLDKHFNHTLRLFLCSPIFTSCVSLRYFPDIYRDYHYYYGWVRPCTGLWKRITTYGCSACGFCLYAGRTSWQSFRRVYLLGTFNQYRFSTR